MTIIIWVICIVLCLCMLPQALRSFNAWRNNVAARKAQQTLRALHLRSAEMDARFLESFGDEMSPEIRAEFEQFRAKALQAAERLRDDTPA